MVKFFLNGLLQESENWLNQIKYLCSDINTSAQKYNIYLGNNCDKLVNLGVKIKNYQTYLEQLTELDCGLEALNLVMIAHKCLKDKFEKIISLTDPYFQLKQTFPFEDNYWQLAQRNQQFQLFIGPKGTSVAKIVIENKRDKFHCIEALSLALNASFQRFPKPDYIDLSNNNLDDAAMQLLANVLNSINGYENIPLSNCEVLILSMNAVSKNGLRILLAALANHPSSRHILLNNNLIDLDCDFLDQILIPKSQQAQLVNLDLTMNFIPKGYMFYNDNIRIYYRTRRMNTKLSACGINLEKRTYTKTMFFSHKNNLRCLSTKNFLAITAISLLAAQDNNNPEKDIDIQCGIIGLFANKTHIPFVGEHAYLMVEGISKFGQRYLVRGDLYTNDGKSVSISVSQCSPQEFLKFTGNGERIYCRTGMFSREKIKTVLDKICESHLEQSFYDYEICPSGHTVNCIKWVINILRESTNVTLDGWIPTDVASHSSSSCNIL